MLCIREKLDKGRSSSSSLGQENDSWSSQNTMSSELLSSPNQSNVDAEGELVTESSRVRSFSFSSSKLSFASTAEQLLGKYRPLKLKDSQIPFNSVSTLSSSLLSHPSTSKSLSSSSFSSLSDDKSDESISEGEMKNDDLQKVFTLAVVSTLSFLLQTNAVAMPFRHNCLTLSVFSSVISSSQIFALFDSSSVNIFSSVSSSSVFSSSATSSSVSSSSITNPRVPSDKSSSSSVVSQFLISKHVCRLSAQFTSFARSRKGNLRFKPKSFFFCEVYVSVSVSIKYFTPVQLLFDLTDE